MAACLACAIGHAVEDLAVEAVAVSGRRDAMSVEARHAPLDAVLKAIARTAGLNLQLEADTRGTAGDWSLREQPLVAVLREVLGCRRWILMEAPTGRHGETGPGELLVLDCPAGASPAETARCMPCPAEPRGSAATASRNQPERVRALAEALRVDGPRAARGNIDAIEALGPDAAIRALERALGAPDVQVRLEVIGAVARIGSDEAVRALARTALGDVEPSVRRAALEAMATLGHPFVPHVMRSALKDADKETRQTAQALLDAMPTEHAPIGAGKP